jgi:hypothetical protein
MVECARCGCRNDRESRFCAACGFSLLAPLEPRPLTPPAGFAAGMWHAPGADFVQPGLPKHTAPQSNKPPDVVAAISPGRATTPPIGYTEPPQIARPILVGFLVSFDGNELGRFWPIHQGRLLVGRSQAADSLDVAIDHGATSARHAQLIALAQPSRVSVQDLGSTNGTFINEQRISPGQPQLVAHGDRIRFGGFNVRVVLVV